MGKRDLLRKCGQNVHPFGAFAGLRRYFHQNAKVSLNVSLKGVDFKREEVREEMRIYNITHFSVLALENFEF